MATRCTIKVLDDRSAFYIYRHFDGQHYGFYGVPGEIMSALPFAWPLPRFEAGDFAAALVRAWKLDGGGDINLTTGHDAHPDTEYQYDLSCRNGALWLHAQKVGLSFGDKSESTRERATIKEGPLDQVIEFCGAMP